jgi:S-formylglutathione hydrolase FrmB
MTIETLSETNCFGGTIGFYRHASIVNNCNMQFSVFVPPQAANAKVPVLTFLSGLTCTEENFMVKSGAQRVAAELMPTTTLDSAQASTSMQLKHPGQSIIRCMTTSRRNCRQSSSRNFLAMPHVTA